MKSVLENGKLSNYWNILICLIQPLVILFGLLSPIISSAEYVILHFIDCLSENIRRMKLEIKKETSKIIKYNDINDIQSEDDGSRENINAKTDVFIFVCTATENCDDMSLKIETPVFLSPFKP